MNPSNSCENDSDVGSSSSWTVLEGNSEKCDTLQDIPNPELNQTRFCPCNNSGCEECVPSAWPMQDEREHTQYSVVDPFCETDSEFKDENNAVHGCLTLEEYMMEQEFLKEFDYVSNDGKRKGNYKPSRRKKCKADSLGTLTIISTVMAVAGVSFLCLLAPNNYSLSSKEIEKLKINSGSGASKAPKSMHVCPVYSDKNHQLSVSDPENVISTLLVNKSDTSARRTLKNIKKNKALKSLGTINLLMDSYHVEKSPTPSKTTRKMQNTSAGVFYGPELPSLVPNDNRKKHIETISFAKSNDSDDIFNIFSSHSCRFLCNVVRDLMLLRVLYSSSQVKSKKGHTRKLLKQAIKHLRQKKEEKRDQNNEFDDTGNQNLKTNLVHNENKKSRKRSRNDALYVEPEGADENNEHSVLPNAPTLSSSEDNLIKNMLDRTNNKVNEFLYSLESKQIQHKLEMDKERSRRQESYMNLIKQRKKFLRKMESQAPKESRSSTLKRNEAIKKLHKIKAEYDLTARVQNSSEQLMLANLSSKSDFSASHDEDPMRAATYYIILSEYLRCEKELTEKQNRYWSKREEYVNERITFLREATNAIRLIVNDYHNNNVLAIKSVERIVDKSAEVLHHDSGVKELQNLMKGEFSEPRYRILDLQTLSDVGSIIPPEVSQTPSNSEVNCIPDDNRSCNSIITPRTTESALKCHAYYKEFFGKMGPQIRKIDMGIFYNNDVINTSLQKNVSKHDPRKRTTNDFRKK